MYNLNELNTRIDVAKKQIDTIKKEEQDLLQQNKQLPKSKVNDLVKALQTICKRKREHMRRSIWQCKQNFETYEGLSSYLEHTFDEISEYHHEIRRRKGVQPLEYVDMQDHNYWDNPTKFSRKASKKIAKLIFEYVGTKDQVSSAQIKKHLLDHSEEFISNFSSVKRHSDFDYNKIVGKIAQQITKLFENGYLYFAGFGEPEQLSEDGYGQLVFLYSTTHCELQIDWAALEEQMKDEQ